MLNPKIYITHNIPENGINMLKKKDYEIIKNGAATGITLQIIKEQAKDANILLTLLTDNIDENVISSIPKLKLISNYAVGYNNIDVNAATSRGIMVTNTPRTLDGTTADFVLALMLSISRRIVESDRYMRSGKFRGWGPLDFIGHDVHGSTLGIIGLGNIGKEVARRAYHGFDMNILYCDPMIAQDDFYVKSERCDLDKLLKESDFVTVNVPLIKETYHLIGENEINLMKRTAYLINTSRGPVVNEKALLNALQEKKIAGAAIDVYENEPVFEPGLEKLDNIIMTPHIASASLRTRELMSTKAAQNIIDFVEGRIPEGLVNKEVLKTYNKIA